jgi:hypothetical protein
MKITRDEAFLQLTKWHEEGTRLSVSYADAVATRSPADASLVNFMHSRNGWHISFPEADCHTSLPRKLNFATEEKIFDLAERGGAEFTSEALAMLEHGTRVGRGGFGAMSPPLSTGRYSNEANPRGDRQTQSGVQAGAGSWRK